MGASLSHLITRMAQVYDLQQTPIVTANRRQADIWDERAAREGGTIACIAHRIAGRTLS